MGRLRRFLGLAGYMCKRMVRQRRIVGLMLISSLIAATFFITLNVVGDSFLAITIADPVARAPIHLSIEAEDFAFSPMLFDEDLRDMEVELQQHPVVASAHRVATFTANYAIIGFHQNSIYQDGVTVISGSPTLGANETYIDLASPNADAYPLGSSIPIPIVYWSHPANPKEIILNLTVVGFVKLSGTVRNIALNNLTIPFGHPDEELYIIRPEEMQDVLVCNWEETLVPLMEYYSSRHLHSNIAGKVMVRLNTNLVLNLADLPGSVSQLELLDSTLRNTLIPWNMTVVDHLRAALQAIQPYAVTFLFNATMSSLIVFLLAGITTYAVGKSAISRRRRELGLLLSKGFNRRTLFGIHLVEAIILTCLATLGGIIGGPLIGAVVLALLGYPPLVVLHPVTALLTVITFGFCFLMLAYPLLSVTWSVTRHPVNEILTGDSTGLHESIQKLRWLVWILFLLGIYKIVTVGLGFPMFSVQFFFLGIGYLGNYIFQFLFYLEFVLLIFAPFFFILGVIYLGIMDSRKLGEVAQSLAHRFLKTTGPFIARSMGIRRRWIGLTILVVTLAFGFVIYSAGLLSTELDHQYRTLAMNVGADLRVELRNLDNVSDILTSIENIEGVKATSLTMVFQMDHLHHGRVTFRAIDPLTWLETAYYENQWFVGEPPETMIPQLQNRNDTFILNTYFLLPGVNGPGMGHTWEFTFPNDPNATVHPLIVEGFTHFHDWARDWPCLISWDLVLKNYDFLDTVFPVILIRLTSSALHSEVAVKIENLEWRTVLRVRSHMGELEALQTTPLTRIYFDFQRITLFATIGLASLGTIIFMEFLILQRTQEQRIMYIRGFQQKWLRRFLFIEVLVIGGLAFGLALVLGILSIFGTLTLFNQPFFFLLTLRLVFLPEAQVVIFVAAIVLSGALLSPVYYRSKRLFDPRNLLYRE